MKLLNYKKSDGCRVGAMTDLGIVDLTAALTDHPGELIQLLRVGADGLVRARHAIAEAKEFIDLATVRVLAPVLRPGKYIGVGANFISHIKEAAHLGASVPKYPIFFNKQTTCVSGPFDPILRPYDSDELDYEGELGIVIGQNCRRVDIARALDVVAGYVVCNDVSVRDWQMRAPTSTMGKSFDSHGPFGPFLVTPDEVGDPHSLRIQTWVNGEIRQDGLTAEMIFNCAELISDLSQKCALEVGDVISVGSPSGVGGLRQPPVYLRAGDVVRVTIDRVGTIENTVHDEPLQ